MTTKTTDKKYSLFLYLLLGLTLMNYCQVGFARSYSPFPDPVNMSSYRGKNNSSFYFYTTGNTSGSLWGSGTYTDDSSLGKAAVHAGLLGVGEKGVIKVTILPGQSSYSSSTAHGITSSTYSTPWLGSFAVAADDGGDNPIMPAPTNLSAYRNYPGEIYLFSITGRIAAGGVWGTNVYTDDSNLQAAAVHAGVLGNGETGEIRVVIAPGQSRYLASTNNGVSTNTYGSYGGSYTISNRNGTTPLVRLSGTPENPAPNPVSVTSYSGVVGGAYYFTVTGNTSGSIWGSGPYTADSSLATAAVHAGILAANQTGTVKVTILPGQSSYTATSAHGVSSSPYGAYSLSYTIAAPDGVLGNIPMINSADNADYIVGQAFSYQITNTYSAKSYNATGLPKGLSINQGTGLISGIPQVTGRFMIDLQTINDSGTHSKTITLNSSGNITPPPSPANTIECLLNWAETHVPELFNPAGMKTEQGFGFDYRYYKGSNTYLGILQGKTIHLLQPDKSSKIIDVGTVEQFKAITDCK